jgi:hypothetical protein
LLRGRRSLRARSPALAQEGRPSRRRSSSVSKVVDVGERHFFAQFDPVEDLHPIADPIAGLSSRMPRWSPFTANTRYTPLAVTAWRRRGWSAPVRSAKWPGEPERMCPVSGSRRHWARRPRRERARCRIDAGLTLVNRAGDRLAGIGVDAQ